MSSIPLDRNAAITAIRALGGSFAITESFGVGSWFRYPVVVRKPGGGGEMMFSDRLGQVRRVALPTWPDDLTDTPDPEMPTELLWLLAGYAAVTTGEH